jgi:hypothetical protein
MCLFLQVGADTMVISVMKALHEVATVQKFGCQDLCRLTVTFKSFYF